MTKMHVLPEMTVKIQGLARMSAAQSSKTLYDLSQVLWKSPCYGDMPRIDTGRVTMSASGFRLLVCHFGSLLCSVSECRSKDNGLLHTYHTNPIETSMAREHDSVIS